MATQLVVKREELKSRQAALAAIFEQAGPDLDLGKAEALKGLADTKARADEVRRLNDELTVLGKEVEQLAEVERVAASVKGLSQEMQHPAKQPETKGVEQSKNLGEMFIESAAFKNFDGRRGPAALLPGVDVKTLMTQAAGWAPENLRMPGYVPSAQRIPTVLDAIPMGTTGQAAVVYMEETTYTNNAAGRTEGANNAGEAALALTIQTANVREFAVWLPVTREQMDDVSQVQGYVNNRLPLMLRQVMSAAILTGAGAPSFTGIIGLAGVQTQAKGADPTPDAIYKAMTLVSVTGRANPNVTIWHPNDWQDVRLLRTADGVYIWGSPSDAGPARIWGLPVIQDSACTENTALVGDFANFTELAMRQGIQLEVTDSHASLFIQRTLAILATVRAALVVYRPAAICQVTGI
jgi:HK97 family phage major capsid protein